MSVRVLSPEGARPSDIPVLLEAGEFVWVDLVGPDEEGIRLMEEVFRFHSLAIKDTRSLRQRPKVENCGDHSFMILNSVEVNSEKPGALKFGEIDVFLGANYVVTVHAEDDHSLEDALLRLRHNKEHHTGSVVHALLDSVVDGYFPLLDLAGELLDELEEAVLADPGSDMFGTISRLKRILLETRRVIGPQRDILLALLRGDLLFLDPEDMPYPLRDVSDHLLRISDMLDSYRDMLTGILDVYVSAVSNGINQVVNRLTAVTVVTSAAP